MLKRRLGRRIGAAVSVGLMSATVLVAASAVPAYATSNYITTYSAFCLTDGGSTTNSTPITQYMCNGNANAQTWDIVGNSNSTNKLENTTNDMCMTNGGSKANSAAITQYKCNGSANQSWYEIPAGTGSYVLFESYASPGECMTNGGSTTNSTPITQYSCGTGSDRNMWFVGH
jgi:Ricin-type beta-trefoil lectin domain